MKKTQNIFSKLWTFLTVNYIFCDVFSLYHSKFLKGLLIGEIDGIEFTEPFLLYFSIIMELPMLMILLSVILKDRINQITNIIVAIIMIIIQIGSLVTGENSLHYVFFSCIEISTLIVIIYIVWKWLKQNNRNKSITNSLKTFNQI